MFFGLKGRGPLRNFTFVVIFVALFFSFVECAEISLSLVSHTLMFFLYCYHTVSFSGWKISRKKQRATLRR